MMESNENNWNQIFSLTGLALWALAFLSIVALEITIGLSIWLLFAGSLMNVVKSCENEQPDREHILMGDFVA